MTTPMKKPAAGVMTNAEADALIYTKTRTTAVRAMLTYNKQRAELFGTNTTVAPATGSTIHEHKRFHIYVKPGVGSEKKEFTSFTLEEARAIIMYERDETDDDTSTHHAKYNLTWGDYAKMFNWIVKDTKLNMTYTYNPSTRMLEPNLT